MISSSQQWSDKGKEAFLKKDYKEALQCYTQAIEFEPTKSVYFSNRSRVNMNLKIFQQALKDAEKSIELDPKNIKGHLLVGQIMAQMVQANYSMVDQLDACIVNLTKGKFICHSIITINLCFEKALTLCAGQKMQKNEKYLNDNIRRVQKLKWLIKKENQKKEDSYLLKQIIEQIQKQPNESEENKRKQIALVKETLEDEEPLQIPEYFKCQISKKCKKLNLFYPKKILQDPVTTRYSNTFERKELEEYFKKENVIRDPVNQQLLQNPKSDVIPNINIKKAIEQFIDEQIIQKTLSYGKYFIRNPWAFEFSENQTVSDMSF